MRRIAISIVTAFMLATPSVALAHYGNRDGGNWEGTPTSGTPTSGTPTSGTTTTPQQAPTPAGTVESFEGETLTIKLANGSVVAGTVNEATHLVCVTRQQTSEPAPPPSPGSWGHDGSWSHDGGSWSHEGNGAWGQSAAFRHGGHHGHRGHASRWHHHGWWHGHGHHGKFGGGPGHGGPSIQPCETSALTKGATVLHAGLSISSEGATWQDVILQTSTS